MTFLLNMRERTLRWLPPFLAVLLALPPAAMAQAVSPNPAAQGPVQSLKVMVLAGDGEMNDIARKVMAPLVVQVLDQDSRPVEGADVTFAFPVTGPSAAFSDGKPLQTVKTNADGQAAAVGWNANQMVGRYRIQVTVTRGNDLGVAMVTMSNVTRIVEEKKAAMKHWYSSKWVKIGLIAGAAAGVGLGVYYGTRGGGGTSTTTLTAVPGFPTIGGAQ